MFRVESDLLNQCSKSQTRSATASIPTRPDASDRDSGHCRTVQAAQAMPEGY